MSDYKEKAKSLGVPLLEELPDESEIKSEEEIAQEDTERAKNIQRISEHQNEMIAVCGACGKEISRKDRLAKQPCGHPQCPFGVLKM